jgi:hypothetical protein
VIYRCRALVVYVKCSNVVAIIVRGDCGPDVWRLQLVIGRMPPVWREPQRLSRISGAVSWIRALPCTALNNVGMLISCLNHEKIQVRIIHACSLIVLTARPRVNRIASWLECGMPCKALQGYKDLVILDCVPALFDCSEPPVSKSIITLCVPSLHVYQVARFAAAGVPSL